MAEHRRCVRSFIDTRIVLVRAVPHDAQALSFVRTIGARARTVLVAPRELASTLAAASAGGVFATLTLPIRRRRLWQVIAAALGRIDLAHRRAAETGGAIGWAPPSLDEARAAKAVILIAEDNATNQIVIRRLLSQRGLRP